ncbi:MAG: type 4a pilus biogenesis protein PilO [Desulfobacterales bacterium]|nr:type 4a pilus biogenesis protein PilO [Desulfobacterales bacterium]
MEKPNLSKSIAPVFEKLEKLSKIQRMLIFGGILFLTIGVFGYFMYFPKVKEIQKLDLEYGELEKKLSAAKNTAKNLPKLQEEINNAEGQLKLVMKALPETKEIPTLLESISLSGQEAGLEFVLFQPGNERNQSFYAEIPVSIQISGNYHNVAVFFDKVARLPRIVNIQDINMKPDPAKKNNELLTSCTALTYKFLDAKAAAPPAGKGKKGAAKKKIAETKPGKHG